MFPLLAVLVALLLVSCTAPDASPPTPSPSAAPAEPPSDNGSDPSPAATIDGEPVRWSDLRPLMAEAAGAQVLAEWVLQQQLQSALTDASLAISKEDIEREKQRLLRRLAENKDQAVRVLDRLRRDRGLGKHRFRLLLRRQAALRKLVADEVNVTDAMVQQAYKRRHGKKTVVRMIVVETLEKAEKVLADLKKGASFIDLAVQRSTDSSAARGGRLPPISPADPSFPKALRKAATDLSPGEVSDPVAIEQGFAILRCERKIKPSGVPIKKVRAQLEGAARRRAERARMQRKARTLIQSADVSVLHDALHQAWQQRRPTLFPSD